MIKQRHILNKKTGVTRIVDEHVKHDSDPDAIKTFHSKHAPLPIQKLDLSPDEEEQTNAQVSAQTA